MFCEGCQKVKTIPVCSGNVTLGTVSVNNTACLMIIADEQTGREWYKGFTSGAAGQAIVDFSGLDFLSDNFRYSVKVIQGSTLANYNTPLPITISATAYDCLYMDFSNVVDTSNDEITGAASITLQVET